MELMLVVVIAATGSALAFPSLRRSVDNQQAKRALETLKSTAQVVRRYQNVGEGRLFTIDVTGVLVPRTYSDLETSGAIGQFHREPGFEYQLVNPISPAATVVRACRPICIAATRTITLQVSTGQVTDSAGFLNPNS